MGKEDKYYFCEDSANKVITFIEKGLVHTKGELACLLYYYHFDKI